VLWRALAMIAVTGTVGYAFGDLIWNWVHEQ